MRHRVSGGFSQADGNITIEDLVFQGQAAAIGNTNYEKGRFFSIDGIPKNLGEQINSSLS